MTDNLHSIEIVPVRCPQCGEAQNTMNGGIDPLAPDAKIGCMVCGYAFAPPEYRRLLAERHQEFATVRAAAGRTDD